MILNIFLLIVGFIILIKGADVFVDGASSVALNFKISKMLIGLTIVAFGTSAPEFAVSVKSLLSDNGDIVLGNVIGSNILNILLILGISSLFHSLKVKNNTVKKELPITILITVLFIVLISDNLFNSSAINNFTKQEGLVVLLFFLVFIYYLIAMMRKKKEETTEETNISLKKAILLTLLGMVGIILGSNFVVDSASFIATQIGISERMISLTIVAFGTSLPELITSITATKQGEYDIAIGNVVGSNIFNIGIVLGLSVFLIGGIEKIAFSYLDLIVLFVATTLLFLFTYKSRQITKRGGIIFLIIFTLYYGYVIFI